MAASEASFTLLIWLNEIVPFHHRFYPDKDEEMKSKGFRLEY